MSEITAAYETRTRVEGGAPGSDEYDTGYIVEIIDDETALVGWDTGVATPTPIADLRPAS